VSKFLHLRYSSDYHSKPLLPKEMKNGDFAATVFQGTLPELRVSKIYFLVKISRQISSYSTLYYEKLVLSVYYMC
jgi:hypothetical protein